MSKEAQDRDSHKLVIWNLRLPPGGPLRIARTLSKVADFHAESASPNFDPCATRKAPLPLSSSVA